MDVRRINDSVFEALFRQAVIDNFYEELDSLPPDEELAALYTFSPEHEARMKTLFARDERRDRLRAVAKWSRRAVAGTAIAATPDVGIAPMWTNASTIQLDMTLNNGTITSEGTLTGKAGTTSISATFTLEKLVNGKYTPVDQWAASSNSMLLSSSHKTTGCTSGTYKLTISATVTKGGVAEAVSDWFTKTL